MNQRIIILVCALVSAIRPAFGQTQLIVNGGFESGIPPWQIVGTGANVFTGAAAYDGSQYLSMGNVNGFNQGVYQTITFPTNLIAATFNFDYNILTTDPNSSADTTLSVYITDTNQKILVTVGSASNLNPTSGYTLTTDNLTTYTGQTNLSAYAGQTVEVYFSVTTDPVYGSLTAFNIDDVSMLIGTTADIPANDNFTNRTVFTAAGITLNANNSFATKEPGEPNHAGNAGGHSLWWSWTAPANGLVTINLAGTPFQALLAVYTGATISNLTSVAANNGSNGRGSATRVTFKASAGTEYEIAVDGYNGASGSAILNFNFALDTVPPKVTISLPAAGAKLTNSFVVLHGTASDNVAVAQVQYRLENVNGTNEYQVATGTNTWSATVTNLIPGPNTVRVRAYDTSSNVSATVSRIFNFVVVSPLTLTRNGNGTVSGAANGQLLDVGTSYKITAKPATGFGFAGWTGDITTNTTTLSFVMRSNLVLQANFKDNARPVLAVTLPKASQRVSNEVFTATGKASDNLAVSNVFYQFNRGAWTNAATTNNWTNWFATNLTLIPGTNILAAYAVDTTGNNSLTNTVKFVYVLNVPMSVQIVGQGTVTPNYNGALLQLSNSYSMTAKAAKGFAFQNWSGGITTTTNATIKFTMQSNLVLIATFKDIAPPVCIITTPTLNQTVTSAASTAAGKASDNVGVTSVSYQFNNGGWNAATIAANGTNWSTPVLTPLSGSNVIQAFAVDGAGNTSPTTSVRFKYVIQPTTDWAPDSLNGLLAFVTPSNGSPESVGFDLTTFAQTGVDTNGDDYGVGNYIYTKTGTNTAQLTLTNTMPPANVTTAHSVELVFTNHDIGYFINEDSGDNGGFSAVIATNLLPGTVAGRTVTAVDNESGKTTTLKFVNGVGFTKTPANNSSSGTSSGTYTYTRFSPVCGILTLTFTNATDLGQVAYVQTTYTNSTAGTYFVTSFDNLGVVQNTGIGKFSLH